MSGSEFIEKVVGRLHRHRQVGLLLRAGGGILLIAAVLGAARPLFGTSPFVTKLLACLIALALAVELYRWTRVPRASLRARACEILDRGLGAKERFTSYEELTDFRGVGDQSSEANRSAQREVISRQLDERVATLNADSDPKQYLRELVPWRPDRGERILLGLIPLLFVLLLWRWLWFAPNVDPALLALATKVNGLSADAHLSPALQEDLQALSDALADGSSVNEISEALAEAEADLNQMRAELLQAASDTSAVLEGDSGVADPSNQVSNSREQDPPTPTPKADPITTPPITAPDRQKPEEKKEESKGEKKQAQEQPVQERQDQQAQDQQEKKEQEKQDQEKQDKSGSEQGSGEEQGQGSSDAKAKSDGEEKESGEEKGDDGQGQGGQGQGASGEGQQQSNSQGSGKKSGGKQDQNQQNDSQDNSDPNAKSGSGQKEGKGAGGSGGRQGAEAAARAGAAGQTDALNSVQQTLSQVQQELEKKQGADRQDEGQQERAQQEKGAQGKGQQGEGQGGANPANSQSERGKNDKAGSKEQDQGSDQEKADKQGSKGQDQSGQKEPDKADNGADKGSEKTSDDSAASAPQKPDQPHQSEKSSEKGATSQSGQARPENQQQSSADNEPGDGSQQQERTTNDSPTDAPANRSSLPERSESAQEFVPGEGAGAEGLGEDKAFKEVEVKQQQEKLDPNEIGQEGELRLNKQPARTRTDLADVQMAKPDAIVDRSKQPIPLEYEGVLQ